MEFISVAIVLFYSSFRSFVFLFLLFIVARYLVWMRYFSFSLVLCVSAIRLDLAVVWKLKKHYYFSVEYVLYYILHEPPPAAADLMRQKQTKRQRERVKTNVCVSVCVSLGFFSAMKKNRFENSFFSLFFPMDPSHYFTTTTNIENISDDFFSVRSFVRSFGVSSRNYFSPAVTINHDFGVVFAFFSLVFVSKRAHQKIPIGKIFPVSFECMYVCVCKCKHKVCTRKKRDQKFASCRVCLACIYRQTWITWLVVGDDSSLHKVRIARVFRESLCAFLSSFYIHFRFGALDRVSHRYRCWLSQSFVCFSLFFNKKK